MQKKRSSLGPRSKNFLIVAVFVSVTGTLIYFEQLAVFYVIANLGLITLLLSVAFADLESVGMKDADDSDQDVENAQSN